MLQTEGHHEKSDRIFELFNVLLYVSTGLLTYGDHDGDNAKANIRLPKRIKQNAGK